MSLQDPCQLDPGFPSCQGDRLVNAPQVDVLFQRLGLTGLLIGVLVGIVLVLFLVFWKTEERERRGF